MFSLWSVQDWRNLNSPKKDDLITGLLQSVYDARTIYKKIDALDGLIRGCDAFFEENPLVAQLKEQAVNLACGLLNANNEKELTRKLNQRALLKAKDPYFMPWSLPKTATQPQSNYTAAHVRQTVVNSTTHNIKSLTQHGKKVDAEQDVQQLTLEEREAYRIFIHQGLFYKLDLNETGNLELSLFDTKTYNTFLDKGKANVLISPRGEIFAGNSNATSPPYFYHSSFTAGEDCLFSGLIEVTEGHLKEITNPSGHYQTGFRQLLLTAQFLREANAIQPDTKVGMMVDENDQPLTEESTPGPKGFVLSTWGIGHFAKSHKPTPKTAVFIINFDGINTATCGSGTFTKNLFQSVLARNQQQANIIPFLITANYDETLPNYDAALLEKHRKECQRYGGNVILLNLTDRRDHFGNIEQWHSLSKQAVAKIIKKVNQLKFADYVGLSEVVIIANDTAYAGVPVALANHNASIHGVPTRSFWIPHCSAIISKGREETTGQPHEPERYEWEKSAVDNALTYHYRISPIGEFMKQHLKDEYGIQENALSPFQSGIILTSYNRELNETEINTELTRHAIPLDKPLIFSIGRGIGNKGHDLAIQTFAAVAQNNPHIHLVLLAPKAEVEDPTHTQRLEKLIEQQGLQSRVTLITSFEKNLAQCMYRHPLTQATLLLVRTSPEDLIPMESRVNPLNAVLLVSNRGSNVYQVADGVDGFIADIGTSDDESIHDATQKLTRILSLSQSERESIVQAGKEKIAQRYDAVKNFRQNFLMSPQEIERTLSSTIENFNLKKEIVMLLCKIGAISFAEHSLTCGLTTSLYIDCRLLSSYPEALKKVAELFATKLNAHTPPISFNKICGVPLGAVPIATTLTNMCEYSGVMLRKEQKEHGTRKQIEGDYQPNQTCLMIEDVTTTGGSLLGAIKKVESQQLIVQNALVFIDTARGAEDNLAAHGYNLKVALPYKEFLQILQCTLDLSDDHNAQKVIQHEWDNYCSANVTPPQNAW